MNHASRPLSLYFDTRIKETIDEVSRGVDEHVGRRDDQNTALRQLVISFTDRIHEQAANAGPREDALGDDRPRQQHAELQTKNCDQREQAGIQKVRLDEWTVGK